jgi:hypothetical protein
MFSGLLGNGLDRFFLEQEPQSVFKQFYNLRVFFVGYPYAYRPEYLVVHLSRVKKNDP